MPDTYGYSGKPLYQKLGLKPGMSCLTIHAPAHYADLIAGVEDVQVSNRLKQADAVHLFCKNSKVLHAKAVGAIDRVKPGGMLWVSWPKKSSSLYIDVTEDDFRRVLLPTGWVDVKVCAVDANWSGLKFLKRRPKK